MMSLKIWGYITENISEYRNLALLNSKLKIDKITLFNKNLIGPDCGALIYFLLRPKITQRQLL